MDLPVGLGASLGQGLQEGPPVKVVAEDGGFAIAAAHDVANGTRVLYPQFSGHEEVWPVPCKVSISYYQGRTPKKVFAQSGRNRMSSKALVDSLRALPDRPWQSALGTGQSSLNWLARQLRPFGITTCNIREGGLRAKGYDLAELTGAFGRFLETEPE